jgi:lipopolysaccharide export LptBFGC system permease protein LptF
MNAKQLVGLGSKNFIEIALYYYSLFVKRADIIFLISFTISTIKVLTRLNENRELVALLAVGLKKRVLLRPIFLFATLVTLIILCNFQWLIPSSLIYVEQFEKQNLKKNKKKTFRRTTAYKLQLETKQTIIFSKHVPAENTFEDLYIISSSDEIWKIKKLVCNPVSQKAVGFYVEHLIRNESGNLILKDYQEKKEFDSFEVDYTFGSKKEIHYESYSLTALIKFNDSGNDLTHLNPQKAKAHLIYKIIISIISHLIIIACAPFCIIFSRKLPIFIIYGISIFGVIGFITLLDCALILAENQVVPPFKALITPVALSLILCAHRFLRCCKN